MVTISGTTTSRFVTVMGALVALQPFASVTVTV
jgi:hypothetical protein